LTRGPDPLASRIGASRGESGSFQDGEALFDGPGFGLDVLEIGFPGLCLGPEFTQIRLQLGDALSPAGEPPMEARGMFRMTTVAFMVFVMPMMLTVTAMTATAAFGLAVLTLAAASFLFAPALVAAGASCIVMAAASTMPMAVASTATPVSAITSAMSAHCFSLLF